MKWFRKRKKKPEEKVVSFWKEDFSDCVTADYLPNYSVCQVAGHHNCRFVACYGGMTLCSNPDHKRFIPEGAEPFNPRKRSNSD